MGCSSHDLIRYSSPFSWRNWGKLLQSSVYSSQYPGCCTWWTWSRSTTQLPSWEWHSISSKHSLTSRSN